MQAGYCLHRGMATAATERTNGLWSFRGFREGGVVGRDLAIDCGLALASFLLAVGLMASGGFGAEEAGARGLDGLGVLLAAAASLPLLARRHAIVPVFIALFAAYAAIAALRFPIDIMLGPLIGLYTLAGAAGRTVPRPLAITLGVASYFAIFGAIAIGYDLARVADVEAPFVALLWVLIWMAGERVQLRREHIVSLEDRARQAEEEAERERRLAAAEERTRIARDLHDSAGHAINVILVEAGAARLLKDRDPDRAEQALRTIEEVAREQIGEIDRIVHALRAEDPDDQGLEDCPPPAGQAAGPEAGDALIQRMRASGLELEVRRVGDPRLLGPSVGRSSFRILQEALTNAVRHGTGSAEVELRYRDDAFEITVTNPTELDSMNGERHGLTGMRERVGLVGGSFEAGQSDGIFQVRAVLPYDPSFDPSRWRNWHPAVPSQPEREHESS
jgi:signal transduction histidine kinase